ncbi:unnamed protein product [Ilex paraguariensis]|uniref:Uncharacterized protein n=1 Tax=Ilex paraguariensis TaxID=185542 RepID=A0ABC8UE15_9AQUA
MRKDLGVTPFGEGDLLAIDPSQAVSKEPSILPSMPSVILGVAPSIPPRLTSTLTAIHESSLMSNASLIATKILNIISRADILKFATFSANDEVADDLQYLATI